MMQYRTIEEIPKIEHEVVCSYCEKKCIKSSGEICCGNQSALRKIDNIMNRCIGKEDKDASSI